MSLYGENSDGSAPGRHILLTGTFCALNKGDAAMQLCAARALGQGAEITILSPHPEIDRQTYEDWNVVKTHRRASLTAFTQLARVALWRALVGVGFDTRSLLRGEEIDAYRRKPAKDPLAKSEFLDHRCELEDFRSCSKDEQDLVPAHETLFLASP